MIIKTYPIGIYEENIYVLVDEKSKDACIVDPGGSGDLLIKKIEELGLDLISQIILRIRKNVLNNKRKQGTI